MSGRGPNGRYPLIFFARLYGGPVETIRLAEFDEPIPGLEQPILIHVNYVDQKVERFSVEEHVAKVVAEMGDNWAAEMADNLESFEP
jgi:hypothetical protein